MKHCFDINLQYIGKLNSHMVSRTTTVISTSRKHYRRVGASQTDRDGSYL
jgi:hypothetical protein